jgi:hypothetical protein
LGEAGTPSLGGAGHAGELLWGLEEGGELGVEEGGEGLGDRAFFLFFF